MFEVIYENYFIANNQLLFWSTIAIVILIIILTGIIVNRELKINKKRKLEKHV